MHEGILIDKFNAKTYVEILYAVKEKTAFLLAFKSTLLFLQINKKTLQITLYHYFE